MKKTAIVFLFLLGVFEMAWSFLTAVRHHGMGPEIARAFDFSKFTEEQRQVFLRFQDTVVADWNSVFFFGLATILIAIFFWSTEIARRKSNV